IARTRRCPMPARYSSTEGSFNNGSPFCTCCAASCPSFTSSAGLYLFGVGATMWVCADAVPIATVSSRIGSKRPWWRKVDMAELMAQSSAMTLPNCFLFKGNNNLIPQNQPRRQTPEAQLRAAYCDRSGRVVRKIFEMAELESGTRPGRHKTYNPAADVESKQVALGIQQAHLRGQARMHQPNTGYNIRTKRFLRDGFRHRNDHVARQCGHSAARNRTRQPRSEELRYLFEVALNAQEIIAEEQRRHTEGHF